MGSVATSLVFDAISQLALTKVPSKGFGLNNARARDGLEIVLQQESMHWRALDYH